MRSLFLTKCQSSTKHFPTFYNNVSKFLKKSVLFSVNQHFNNTITRKFESLDLVGQNLTKQHAKNKNPYFPKFSTDTLL